MEAADLKARQAPLKELYRQDPARAVVTLHARAHVNDVANVSCNVETGRAMVAAGLHPASGGTSDLICSGDMLLQALVACAGVTLRAVATSTGIKLRGGEIAAEGELDFRGTLGVDRAVPVGFRAIRLRFDLDVDGTHDDVATLQKLTERYCVVYQTLVQGVPLATEFASI